MHELIKKNFIQLIYSITNKKIARNYNGYICCKYIRNSIKM